MKADPFKPEDLLEMDPTGQLPALLTPQYGQLLLARGPAYTIRAGQILLCGGIAADDAGQGWLWSFVAPAARAQFIGVHRYVARFLEVHHQPLIATTAQRGPGCKWLELLGFVRGEPMAGFFEGCPNQFVYRRA